VADSTVNVQPHGRILTVLGDIEFAPWQCLAELTDNAFDDFLSNGGPEDDRPTVSVSLPGKNSDPRTGEVWVTDNGRGMDLATLANAVSAGWTGNTRYEALGLYGMGFNIATARLGRVATVRTTRSGDPSWTVITLDLDELAKGRNYDVPVRYEPKEGIRDHGTQVIISKLKTDQWDLLTKQAGKIRDQLGNVYSYLLREQNFLLTVSRTKVQPLRPCVWSEERAVTRSGVRIPAIIQIDEPLPPALACLDCGWWTKEWAEECENCEGQNMRLRDRRIWGWIGVQRYLHKTDFGIDFLRNGRKVLIRDKRLFSWDDPDQIEPPKLEYPIDTQRPKGRFVGEIHCDHVPVNYQKSAFVYDSPEWKRVVRTIRGSSPLGEKIAANLGLPRNTSPLARLYTGYRREDQGLNYLVAANDTAVEWAKRFREGSPDTRATTCGTNSPRPTTIPLRPARRTTPEMPSPRWDSADPQRLSSLHRAQLPRWGQPGGHSHPGPSTTRESEPEETLDQRLDRYREAAAKIFELTGRYEATGLGAVELTPWAVETDTLTDAHGNVVPVFAQMTRPPKLEIFIAVEHPLLTEFGIELRDLVMTEVAEYMRVRGTPADRGPKPLSAVLFDIKSRAPEQKITRDVLANRAGQLLDRIREAMLEEVKGSPSGYWSLLPASEQGATQRRFAVEGGGDTWDSVLESGDFTVYLPASALVRLIERRPESFLDGKVFRRRYIDLTDESSRSLVVSRLAGFISDLALIEDLHPRLGLPELQRARLSCSLVEQELVSQE
jgi:hypothetical protein